MRLMNRPECPFCQPLPRERIILESVTCIAFLDGYPVSEGHTLVVPRLHVRSIFELPDHVQQEIWGQIRLVRAHLDAKHRPAGFNVGLNDGQAAGQTIGHAHIHIIPRYTGDLPDPRGGVRWVIPAKAKYW